MCGRTSAASSAARRATRRSSRDAARNLGTRAAPARPARAATSTCLVEHVCGRDGRRRHWRHSKQQKFRAAYCTAATTRLSPGACNSLLPPRRPRRCTSPTPTARQAWFEGCYDDWRRNWGTQNLVGLDGGEAPVSSVDKHQQATTLPGGRRSGSSPSAATRRRALGETLRNLSPSIRRRNSSAASSWSILTTSRRRSSACARRTSPAA